MAAVTYRCPVQPEQCPTSARPGYCEEHNQPLERLRGQPRREMPSATLLQADEPTPAPQLTLALTVLGCTVLPPEQGEMMFGRDLPPLAELPGIAEQLYVSRWTQARIYRQAGQLWLADAGSTNGTYVDGVRIDGQPVPLRPRQRVSFGRPPDGLRLDVVGLDEFGMPS